MFSATYTVLVLADEVVTVFAPVRSRYTEVGEIRWGDPEFMTSLAELLAGRGHGNPIMILYDMVEQYYRREVVPKVAILDQKRVLMRRLSSAFPNYPMRGFIPLKPEAKGKGDTKEKGVTGYPYLFAALPDHDSMSRITESIRMSMAHAKGIFLLPIESIGLVRQLSKALNDGDEPKDRWIVFMAQHKGGGLRQIVVRNGELALTRLTPVVDTDIDPQAWANEVHHEFTATMGYLSRFGYTSNSELEVICLGNDEATTQLEPLIKATNFHGISVRRAATLLKLPVSVAEGDRYGDIVHVGGIVGRFKHVLSFQVKELAFISQARMMGKAAAGLLTLGALCTLGYTGYLWANLFQTQQDIVTAKDQMVQLEKDYNAELARKESYNIDVKLVQGSIGIFDKLEKGKVDVIDVLQRISAALTPELSFDRMEMGYNVAQTTNPDPLSVQTIESKRFFTRLTISFDPGIKPESGNKTVSDLRDRLSGELKEYDVTVERPVQDLTFRNEFRYEAGVEAEKKGAGSGERPNAVILISQKAAKNG